MQGRLRSRLILLLFFFNESTTQRYVDRDRHHESLSLWNIVWLAPTLCQFQRPNRLHYAANQTNKSFTLRLRTCKGIRIPECGKYLLVESRFHNTAQGIRNPTRDWNSKSKSHCPLTKTGIQYLESRIRDCLRFSHIGRNTIFPLTHDLPHLLTFSY